MAFSWHLLPHFDPITTLYDGPCGTVHEPPQFEWIHLTVPYISGPRMSHETKRSFSADFHIIMKIIDTFEKRSKNNNQEENNSIIK